MLGFLYLLIVFISGIFCCSQYTATSSCVAAAGCAWNTTTNTCTQGTIPSPTQSPTPSPTPSPTVVNCVGCAVPSVTGSPTWCRCCENTALGAGACPSSVYSSSGCQQDGFGVTRCLATSSPTTSPTSSPTMPVTTNAGCGNGIVEPGEQCDDPSNSCCTSSCQFVAMATAACDDGDACTSNETCDGQGSCTGGTSTCNVCGNGIVDPGEECDDSNNLCCTSLCQMKQCNDNNPCTIDSCASATGNCVSTMGTGMVVCRAATGPCDVVEYCDFSSASVSCPADGFKASGVVCRASSGPFDMEERCDGFSVQCPADTGIVTPSPTPSPTSSPTSQPTPLLTSMPAPLLTTTGASSSTAASPSLSQPDEATASASVFEPPSSATTLAHSQAGSGFSPVVDTTGIGLEPASPAPTPVPGAPVTEPDDTAAHSQAGSGFLAADTTAPPTPSSQAGTGVSGGNSGETTVSTTPQCSDLLAAVNNRQENLPTSIIEFFVNGLLPSCCDYLAGLLDDSPGGKPITSLAAQFSLCKSVEEEAELTDDDVKCPVCIPESVIDGIIEDGAASFFPLALISLVFFAVV